MFSHIGDRVVGQINDQIRIADTFFIGNRSWLFYLETAKHSTDSGNQLFGVKGLDNIVICPKLQSKNFVKGFSLGGKHDDWNIRAVPDFSADLVTVNSREHQIQYDQIRLEVS